LAKIRSGQLMSDTRTEDLLQRYRSGEHSVLDELLEIHRERLRRMLTVRLNPHVRPRVDESDILQDTLIKAVELLPQYLEKPPMPFFVWLRWLASQQLKQCHRFHLDAGKRDARKNAGRENEEVGLSAIIAQQFVQTTPSQIVAKQELMVVVVRALDAMKAMDRDILCMRHLEQMTNQEVAAALEIDESAASTRYLRALDRLQKTLERIPGSDSG